MRRNYTNKKNTKMENENQYTYQYPHPAVATDCVVFGFDGKKLRILLIRRGVEPFKDMWAFPGGFMRIDETAEQCALRELVEETGLELTQMKQLGVFSDIHRDPRERVVSIAFYALAKSTEVRGGDDAALAQWFAIDEVPHLAFDHDYILRKAMRKIKEDIHFEPVGFGLLGESFSMTELQTLYEAILGVHFDRRNFYKKLMQTGVLEEVDSDGDALEENVSAETYGKHAEMKAMSIDNLFMFGSTRKSVAPIQSKGIPGRKSKLFRFNKEKYNKYKENNEFRLEF